MSHDLHAAFTASAPPAHKLEAMRRFALAAVVLAASIAAALLPASVGAVSTSTEVAEGIEAARHVDAESALVTDPVLVAWVRGLTSGLAKYRARPDVTYSTKIVDSSDINAFSLPGGPLYVDAGLLDFVDSDDELAGVIGHEMGHVERRHQVTLAAKAQGLNILLGVLSLYSPFVYRYGNILGGLAFTKFSRVDELQADQYGLLLVDRAGYDPNATVSFLDRLRRMYGDNAGGISRYFATHPDPVARVDHLRGYAQLDKPGWQAVLARAIHVQEEGRYAYASAQLDDVLKVQPDEGLALLHKAETSLALGRFDVARRAATKVAGASDTTAAGRAAAATLLAEMAEPAQVAHAHPPAASMTPDALASKLRSAARQLDDETKLADADMRVLTDRIDALNGEMPYLQNVDIRKGSRLDGAVTELEHVAREVNLLSGRARLVGGSSRSALGDDAKVASALLALEKRGAPGDVVVTPYIPEMAGQLSSSVDRLLLAPRVARGAISLGLTAMPAVSDYLRTFRRTRLDFGSDISPSSAKTLTTYATRALDGLRRASNAAGLASDEYFAARALEIEARITLLGLSGNSARYATFARVIKQRLGVDVPSLAAANAVGLSPGEAAAAAWLAAEERRPVGDVLAERSRTGLPVVDLARTKNLYMRSLEITLGLWWLGYTS